MNQCKSQLANQYYQRSIQPLADVQSPLGQEVPKLSAEELPKLTDPSLESIRDELNKLLPTQSVEKK